MGFRQIGSVAPGLVEDAGAQDDEHPAFHAAPRGPPVQQRLSLLLDEYTVAGIKDHFRQAQCTLDVERLSDLGAAGVSHSWLWAISPNQGPVIEEETEFVEAVRVRLGAGGPPDVGLCGCCGKAQLDLSGGHASCCSLGEATAGHNALRDSLFGFACEADPASEWEPTDLVPSRPWARPADVLTPAAITGRVAALDVGVTAPAAARGEDATEQMFRRKLREREPERPELESQNIVYRPVVWTCYGRPHPAAVEVIRNIARRIARRRGRASQRAITMQIHAAFSVCIARRAARMSLACWPRDLHGGGAGVVAASAAHNHFAMAPGSSEDSV